MARELLALQPSSTLSFTRRFPRYLHAWMTDLFIEGLRKSGCPNDHSPLEILAADGRGRDVEAAEGDPAPAWLRSIAADRACSG